jgi:hypothetical protein
MHARCLDEGCGDPAKIRAIQIEVVTAYREQQHVEAAISETGSDQSSTRGQLRAVAAGEARLAPGFKGEGGGNPGEKTKEGEAQMIEIVFIGMLIVLVVISALMLVMPIYNVWSSRKSGEADLAQAQAEQQIQVARALGRKNAATLNKEAAIIEAEAVREQINRIGEGLKEHDLYLRWQWIRMMEEREGETIYVPTEANLPLLEATRRR